MNELNVNIFTKEDELPAGVMEDNFFHSPQLFRLSRQTPRHKPYMVVVQYDTGEVVSQMLALVRYRSSWLPPMLYMHCRVLGEGVYRLPVGDDKQQAEAQKAKLFTMMLKALTDRLGLRMLYIEVSNLSQKMFGYKEFRQAGYFPVRWTNIHNSLHAMEPDERISERLRKRIDTAYARGAVTLEVSTDKDLNDFMRLLNKHNWLKPKRYIPHVNFFRGIQANGWGRLYITRYHEHAIGCSAVVYSSSKKQGLNNAYLWYAAFRRKSFVWLHPDEVTIWHAIKDSHRHGYDHFVFLDVGLPAINNHYREFILRFGGKPTSTYRWFHTNISLFNRLFSWFYRD